jgi:hypothetical protein
MNIDTQAAVLRLQELNGIFYLQTRFGWRSLHMLILLSLASARFGYHPEIILAGRRLNGSMADYVASQIVKLMIKGIAVNGASLLMLGMTFKENCPDVRNTRINVIDAN